MQQLSAQATIKVQDLQLEIVKQAAEQAQHTLANFVPPVININKVIAEAVLYQMQKAVEATSWSKIAANVIENQQKALASIPENLFASVIKQVSLTFPSTIIDAEIVGRTPTINPQELKNTVIPYQPSASALTIPEQSFRTRSKYGLAIVAQNSVTYKRKTLKGISARNVEGRFLIYLLSRPNLFISDEEIREQFHIMESRSASWIVRDLRNKFKNNGLKIEIERRWNPDGYILIDVRYLQ